VLLDNEKEAAAVKRRKQQNKNLTKTVRWNQKDEMRDFGPEGPSTGRSPDRLDALAWALTVLMLEGGGTGHLMRRYHHSLEGFGAGFGA
jgi:phage terminase large subunit-like protein